LTNIVSVNFLPGMHKHQVILARLLIAGTIQMHSSCPAILGIKHENDLALNSQAPPCTARTELDQLGECQVLDSIKSVQCLPSLLSEGLRGCIARLKSRGNLYLVQGLIPMSTGLLGISLSRLCKRHLLLGPPDSTLETRLDGQSQVGHGDDTDHQDGNSSGDGHHHTSMLLWRNASMTAAIGLALWPRKRTTNRHAGCTKQPPAKSSDSCAGGSYAMPHIRQPPSDGAHCAQEIVA
jgi:hypothetical protein